MKILFSRDALAIGMNGMNGMEWIYQRCCGLRPRDGAGAAFNGAGRHGRLRAIPLSIDHEAAPETIDYPALHNFPADVRAGQSGAQWAPWPFRELSPPILRSMSQFREWIPGGVGVDVADAAATLAPIEVNVQVGQRRDAMGRMAPKCDVAQCRSNSKGGPTALPPLHSGPGE